MSKHTPGPWFARRADWESNGNRWWINAPSIMARGSIRLEPHGAFVAQVGSGGGDLIVVEADARLIATAPELLEALKEVRAFAGSMNEDEPYLGDKYGYNALKSKLASVIAKAECE